jgi:hypothetical protein
MAFQESTTVPHTPAAVATALMDEGFHRAATEKLGGVLAAFSREGDPTGPITVTMVRTVPVNRLPEAVQKIAGKFLGEKLNLEQTERWSAPAADGSRTGHLVVTIPTAKVTATGEQTMVPSGTGTELTVTGTVECKIPLVGGKVAGFAEPKVGSVLRRQSRELTQWLSR